MTSVGIASGKKSKVRGTAVIPLLNYVVDVMGRRVARMLKQSSAGKDDAKSSFFQTSAGKTINDAPFLRFISKMTSEPARWASVRRVILKSRS